eukprot:TRINITY_DN8285_c0_g1_i5.p3 TRINITY_DN8285_c0_g1~~TRINITY_DN8285_c0_g1_i5.p3  ORF type:complete len:121 (-),score=9.10 TRINITY_DN8285_c0_g1_i5:86-448(-)
MQLLIGQVVRINALQRPIHQRSIKGRMPNLVIPSTQKTVIQHAIGVEGGQVQIVKWLESSVDTGLVWAFVVCTSIAAVVSLVAAFSDASQIIDQRKIQETNKILLREKKKKKIKEMWDRL